VEAQRVVKAKLAGNQVIRIEARPVGSAEVDIKVGQILSFDGLVKSIEEVSNGLATALQKAKPDRAAIEFGIDVGVEAGALTALIVKGTGTATLKVTLEWSSPAGGSK
jgi:hypothetical protein